MDTRSNSLDGFPKNLLFYPPVDGIVTSKFDLSKNHFGIDIVAKHNSAIKAVLDGTVVFAGWTLETGYIIAIQHQQNLVSFYTRLGISR